MGIVEVRLGLTNLRLYSFKAVLAAQKVTSPSVCQTGTGTGTGLFHLSKSLVPLASQAQMQRVAAVSTLTLVTTNYS